MPISLSAIGTRELKGFARDLRKYGNIEGVALGRATRDGLKKVGTQMGRDVSKEISIPVGHIKRRFGKRVYLDKIRGSKSDFRSSLGVGTRYTIPAAYGINVRERRPNGVKLRGHEFPKAYLIRSRYPIKRFGAVMQRQTGDTQAREVGIDFIEEVERAWEKNQNLASDNVDSRYTYWRERLYAQFFRKNGEGAKAGFVKGIASG